MCGDGVELGFHAGLRSGTCTCVGIASGIVGVRRGGVASVAVGRVVIGEVRGSLGLLWVCMLGGWRIIKLAIFVYLRFRRFLVGLLNR